MIKKIKYPWLFFVIVLAVWVVQLILFYYKDLMHIDEIFSYGAANGEFGVTFKNGTGSENNTLLTKEDFLSYLLPINSTYKSMYHYFASSDHMPLYFVLLHTACLLFMPNFSLAPGILLNMIILFFMMLGMYRLLMRLFCDEMTALCGLVLFAFLGPVLAMAVYIRMYLLWMMFSAWYVYYMIRLLQEEKLFNRNLLFAALFGFLQIYTHFYGIIFAFVVTATGCFLFLLQKKYKKMLYLGFSMLAVLGAVYLLFPQMIEIGLRGERGSEFMRKFNALISQFSDMFNVAYGLFSEVIGGHWKVFYSVLLMLCLGLMIGYRGRVINQSLVWSVTFLLIVFLGYSFLSSLIQPRMTGVQVRYYSPVVPIAAILLVALLFIWGRIIHLSLYVIALVILVLAGWNGIYQAVHQNSPYYMRSAPDQDRFANMIKGRDVWWGSMLGYPGYSWSILFGIDKLLHANQIWVLTDAYHPDFIEFAKKEKEEGRYAYWLLPGTQAQYPQAAVEIIYQLTGRRAYYLFTMYNNLYSTTFSGSVFLVAPY